MVEQREKEILQIVRSIHDLNEIFKDLATMVVDQVWCVSLVLLEAIFSIKQVIASYSYDYVSLQLSCFYCCSKVTSAFGTV